MLNDKTLSLQAKGLYAYLFSKPDGWQFSGDRIADDQADGRRAVFAALNELERTHWLTRRKLQSGRMLYRLEINGAGDFPVAENRNLRKAQFADSGSINKTEENKDGKGKEKVSVDFTDEELQNEWAAFQLNRIEMRKPMTTRARRRIIENLNKWGKAKALQALSKAITGGWTDVYEPKSRSIRGGIPAEPEKPVEESEAVKQGRALGRQFRLEREAREAAEKQKGKQ